MRTIFGARQFIKHGNVTVNGKVISNMTYIARPGDAISVIPSKRIFIKKNILRRFLSKDMHTSPPAYLFISYPLVQCVFMNEYFRSFKLIPIPQKRMWRHSFYLERHTPRY